MLLKTFLIRNARYYSSHGGSKQYDVVIAGGGMIGNTLACAIAQSPILKDLSILMIESGPKKATQITKASPYSNRVSSINPSSQNLLNSIGAWDHIKEVRYQNVDTMKVWGHSSNELLEFDKSHNYQDNISFLVENDLIIQSVNQQLDKSNVEIIYGGKVAQYQLPQSLDDKIKINMESGEIIESKLLLGTDGARSQVRVSMNVTYSSWDYDQKGIVATLKVSTPSPNTTAWQRFIPSGTIALLPLSDEVSSLVWSTTPENAKDLLQMSPESFVDALNAELNKSADTNKAIELTTNCANKVLDFFNLSSPKEIIVPPRILSVEDKSRAAFPLGFGHSARYVGPSTALLGDAAHKVHPLAGQGVNLGFGDIIDFVQLAEDSVANGYTIGHHSLLTKYESLRQKQNIPTMLSIEIMYRIYRSTFTPVRVAGSLGFQLINAIRPVKRVMMSRVS